MMKNSIYLLFILPLLFIELSAQTLPSDLIWNDDETAYYEIKENNIYNKEINEIKKNKKI